MTAALLQVDPGLRVFHRNGTLFAGRLSGTMRLQRIGPPDLVLLSMFLLPGAPEARARGFVEGPGTRLFSTPPPLANVLARIAQLRDAGLLVAGAEQDGDVRVASTLQDCSGCAPVAPDSGWRLSSNFLLQPTPAGFAVNSPAVPHPIVLDIGLALLLTEFAAGRAAGEVAAAHPALGSTEQRLKAVAWLAERRVLLPQEAGTEALAAPAQPAAFAVNRSTGDKPAWQLLEPDGRIPVYFVPHMENHYPLALGMIAAAMRVHAGGRLMERFQLLPITYMSPQELIDGPYRRFGPGVWLFSNYMWSLAVNLQVSAAVKHLDGRNLTLHGGPSTPNYEAACEAFYARHGSVDMAVHGEGEIATAEAFECLRREADGRIGFDHEALAQVAGVSFRDPAAAARVVRAPARMRLRQLDALPSPYLEGVFDDYAGRVEAAIVETNRGCPFACTFCDWGSATNGKIAKFEHGRVRDEIEWIGRNQVRVLWIADANFGMLPADLEFAEWVVATKRRYGFPQEVVVNYTKNANTRLADIIRVFSGAGIVSQGIISIQTTDEETLRIIDRQNIKTSKYDELLRVFADAGLPLSTDLMIGLPGATVASFARDLQRYLDVDVAVKAYPTQLLPNSPMAAPEYREKYRIEV
ncbi:MAG TPA: radical SAM protein, partial [Gammaproteobacteria bacterium]|nr:radical SAM protein [Gammaproteobacteria bacterium]